MQRQQKDSMNGTTTSKLKQQKYKNSFQVIIVGSGLAGLSAAAHLVENGVSDICVLEAKNTLGGRIHTIGVNGNPLELGAQYIFGACAANSVFNLANKHKLFGSGDIQRLHEDAGLAIKRWPLTAGYVLRPDGIPISESATEQAYEIFNGIAEEAENLARLRLQHHGADRHSRQASRLSTFYSGRKKKALEGLRKAQSDNVAEVDLVLNGLQRALAVEAGHDLNRVKLEAFGSSTLLPGGTVSINGTSKLIEKLAQTLPPNCLKYNHEVQKIDWSLITRESCMPDKISVECRIQGCTGTGPAIVKSLLADFVICTLPLGYLQRHHDRIFYPRLHPQKTHAIEDLGVGQVCKLFLEWSEPWWAPNEGGIQLAWPSDPNHVHFQHRGFRNQSDNPRIWYRSLCNFCEVENHPNVLATWLAGEAAKVVDQLDDEEIMLTITDVLRSFTGDPGLNSPRRLWRHRWSSDPYIMGGWPFQTTASCTKDIEALAQPLPSTEDPRLLFAGDATDSRHLGNLLGARLSGLREAQRILDRLEVKNRIAKEVRLVSTNGF